jgi:hypothetical protein
MTSRTAKSMLSAAVLAFGLAVTAAPSADAAQAPKGKKKATTSASVSVKPHPKARVAHRTAPRIAPRTTSRTAYWGTRLVPAGPLYHGPEYLGDDPDPNIRFELMRDLSGRYGGDY